MLCRRTPVRCTYLALSKEDYHAIREQDSKVRTGAMLLLNLQVEVYRPLCSNHHCLHHSVHMLVKSGEHKA